MIHNWYLIILQMKNNTTLEKLINFIATEYWVDQEKVSLDTKIGEDLKIGGDDGIEFLEKFLDYFNIDYDKNRQWQQHFDSEGFSLINFIGIYNWFRGRKDNQKLYDLTIEHLVKVIELGYWIDMKDE
ncbi:conserved hypothetical protein [Tenacibaculum maritimum]|nr:conserved hypothetical protein [Tenacibaculum maritimum]CAA0158966.1 conserved hypothetical protein [Tenacibaculum maritimum]CAA0202776.1 conserved hypothetical protein [Tenacibaculum maritimum]CAA0206258.1 conserved hypothetical protein [Tenacibaculum maritimum]CAA0224001.1 conserved hypothetical protein [Tenacibaculum maritimum]